MGQGRCGFRVARAMKAIATIVARVLLLIFLAFCQIAPGAAQSPTGEPQPAGASGQWPSRSIRLIIPAAPGGAVDTIARLLAEKLTIFLGQPVIPENHGGASTTIASELTARSAPDGYTVLVNTGSHTINAALRPGLRYESIQDFAPVSVLATLPDRLVVRAGLPVKDVGELLQYARQHPGELTFGSAGTASASHLDAELFRAMTGIDILHVPYKTGTAAVAAVVAGQIDLLFFNAIGVLPQIQSGRIRALAITSAARSPLVPDIPTMQEQGIDNYLSNAWYGVMVRAGTPQSIVDRLSTAVVSALQSPDVSKTLRASGANIVGSTPRAMAQFLESDIARWKDLARRTPALQALD